MRRVLYKLPEVIAAEEVWITEGERDADNLAAIGLTATTNSDGASQKWLAEWTDTLSGKRVIITPDSDAPGVKRGEVIANELKGKAAEVVIVRMPSPHKDISDSHRRACSSRARSSRRSTAALANS